MIGICKQVAQRARVFFHSRAFLATVLLLTLAGSMLCMGVSVRRVQVIDGDAVYTAYTHKREPAQILNMLGISYDAADKLELFDGGADVARLLITRAFPVTLRAGAQQIVLKTTGGTVAELLETAGVQTDEDDLVNYPLTAALHAGMCIDIVSVDFQLETLEESIPYGEQAAYSAALSAGQVRYTKGTNGRKRVVYHTKLVNGEVAERSVVSEEILSQPVAAVKTIGTRNDIAAAANTAQWVSSMRPAKPIALNASGAPVSYQKVLTGSATAYTASPGATCATGVKAQTGYVAVDPKIIPYGTKLYIRSTDGRYVYGYAIAADTGGFIKTGKTIVDLYFNTYEECIQFGRRQVEIYILA